MPDREPIGYIVKRLRLRVRSRLDQVLERHGLSAASFEAMTHLVNGTASTSAELSRACSVTPQTMHRVVAGLKERGLVREMAGTGRALVLEATRSGEKAFRVAWDEVLEIERQMLSGLASKEVARLRDMLLACERALEVDAETDSEL